MTCVMAIVGVASIVWYLLCYFIDKYDVSEAVEGVRLLFELSTTCPVFGNG